MADNNKELRITSIYDTRGAEKVRKEADDLRKVYDALGRSVKEVQKTLADLDNIQKRNTDVTVKETDALRQQIEQLKALRQAHLGVAQAAGGFAGMGYRTQGQSPTGYGAAGTYGNMPASQRGFSAGVDTSAYAGSYDKYAAYKSFAKIAGGIGAGVGLIGQGMQAYGGYLQRQGQNEINEKFMPMEHLAAAQGYRNQVFMEARSGPVGYSAYRAAHEFGLKSRESGRVTTDEFGRITQPEDAIKNRIGGGAFTSEATNMAPEAEVRRGKWWEAASGGAIGLGKAIGGVGLMAGAVPAGIATGGIGGIAAGVGGAALFASGAKDIVNAIWGVRHEEKKEKEGKPEAEQSEAAQRATKAMDEVLAITRYQMEVFNQRAGVSVSGGRQSLGNYFQARGQTDFDLGEALGITTSATRNFGRAGKAGLGTIFDAARRGMSSEAATQVVGTYGSQGADGNQMLKNMMAAGVKAGMESLDMGFFEKLAVAAAKSSYSASGGIRDPRAAAAFFSGKMPTTPYELQERMGGMKTATSLFTENAYFRSRGTVEAARILGSGAEGAQVSALSGAGFEDLIGKGSEKLQAMGINESQIKAFRGARIRGLGDVLGGYGAIKKRVGGQDFEKYLQQLAQRLKSKKTRSGAMGDLNALSAYGSALTGEQFGDLRGMLQAYGVSDADMKLIGSGRSGMPGALKNLGGAGSTVISTKNQGMAEDEDLGNKASANVDVAETLVGQGGEFLSFLQDPKNKAGSRAVQNLLAGNAQQKTQAARTIQSQRNRFEAQAAQGAGEGYDSAQKLNASLGNFNAMLEKRVNVQLEKMAKTLERIVPALDRVRGFR